MISVLIKFEYDKDVDAGYVYLKYPVKRGEARRTVTLNENIIVDFDRKNRLIGIEILNASRLMGRASLKRLAKSA